MRLGEYSTNYSEGAASNLRIGKEAYENKSYVVAFNRSFWALENILKAVLVKSGNFDNWGSGDRHHRCLDLLNKIGTLGIIPTDIFDQVRIRAIDLLTVNIYDDSGQCHMDSPASTSHKIINDIRYFDASEYIGLNDSRSKIQDAEIIYNLLKPFM